MHYMQTCSCCCLVSVASNFLSTLWAVVRQAPLSMGFSRQEYWSGLPGPPPGNLPNPGTEPASLELAGGFFTIETPGKPDMQILHHFIYRT